MRREQALELGRTEAGSLQRPGLEGSLLRPRGVPDLSARCPFGEMGGSKLACDSEDGPIGPMYDRQNRVLFMESVIFFDLKGDAHSLCSCFAFCSKHSTGSSAKKASFGVVLLFSTAKRRKLFAEKTRI